MPRGPAPRPSCMLFGHLWDGLIQTLLGADRAARTNGTSDSTGAAQDDATVGRNQLRGNATNHDYPPQRSSSQSFTLPICLKFPANTERSTHINSEEQPPIHSNSEPSRDPMFTRWE